MVNLEASRRHSEPMPGNPMPDNPVPGNPVHGDILQVKAQITGMLLKTDVHVKLSLTVMEPGIPERETIEATLPRMFIHGFQIGDMVTIRVEKQ